ncbi:VTT domain-containing protein [Salinibius halmophilus]|uniref:VTT domain-containing protein n=1 Tax=Salinibius halmophilus TaxID=1853216 RepID=UPI000E6651F2|nr:VTT domain-containing protein [Salinibius halmophilus]
MNKRLAIAWACLIAAGILSYLLFLGGDLSDITQQAKALAAENFALAAIIYTVILSFRGMTFIPSTPLLFIGMAIFPAHFTFWVNMLGILISCLLVIYSIHRVGIDTALATVNNKQYIKIRDRIDRNGYYAIVLWSFFPFAPTDAIVYVASSIGVSRRKIVAGVMTGEAILNAAYVYGAGMLIQRILA